MNRKNKLEKNDGLFDLTYRNGFTLVELSLSMVFIAILSILIVLIINNAVSSYHRGITLNLINTVGTDVVSDMRKSVQSSTVHSIVGECEKEYSDEELKTECKNDMAHNFVSVERLATVTVGENKMDDVPVFGAFCTGKYSYIWNSGYYFSSEAKVQEGVERAYLEYSIGDVANERRDFKLLKVKDLNMRICKSAVLAASTDDEKIYSLDDKQIGSRFSINVTSDEEEINDVLSSDNNNVALYDLKTAIPAESRESNSVFYSVSFILGTVQGGININTIGNYCATPKGFNSGVANFDYCAINKFNFAAWANGER